MAQITTQQTRIDWIDIAKGIGIIAIIVGHIGSGYLGKWFYSFHVPLFFFLSGFVFNANYQWKTFLIKKIKGILIPYFALGVPLLLFDVLLTEASFGDLFYGFLFQERQWTIWFLAVLFLLNLTFYFLLRLRYKSWIISILSFVSPILGLIYYANGGGKTFWNIDVFVMALPFFYTGLLYKKYLGHILPKNIYVCTFITLILNLVLTFKYNQTIDMFGASYSTFPLSYINALLGIAFVIFVSKQIKVKWLKYLGSNSLIYFAWHQTIMFPIVWKILSVCNYPLGNDNLLFYISEKLLELGLILLFTTIVNEMINRSKFKCLLGR